MAYLDFERLRTFSADEFRNARPYPWLNPHGVLTDEGFRRLVETCPDVALFNPVFGVARKHGQQSHDRLTLEYQDTLDIAVEWKEFVRELRSPEYSDFLERVSGRRSMSLSFHWHFTPAGCSVSPHCDAKHKIGSHIFYLNSDTDWKEEWGGQTVVLDDGGRFARNSAPRFEDFKSEIEAKTLGNYSFLFMRQGNSWHGVRAIRCPEGMYRKVFIVVINDRWKALRKRFLDRMRGKVSQDY